MPSDPLPGQLGLPTVAPDVPKHDWEKLFDPPPEETVLLIVKVPADKADELALKLAHEIGGTAYLVWSSHMEV